MTSAGPSSHKPANECERKRASCQAGRARQGCKTKFCALINKAMPQMSSIVCSQKCSISASIAGWAGSAGKQVGIFRPADGPTFDGDFATSRCGSFTTMSLARLPLLCSYGRVRVCPPPTCIQPSEAQALELVFVEIKSWICAIAGQPCSPTQSEHGFLTGFQLFPPFIT